MRQLWISAICILALLLSGCSNSDLYDDMPREIQNFISQYYPNSQLDSFTSSDNGYVVIVKNGPTMVFDIECQWTRVDGDGMPLPANFLFNEFPTTLYDYLQETENTNQVFCATRSVYEYTIELLDYTLTYDIATDQITGKQPNKVSDVTYVSDKIHQ